MMELPEVTPWFIYVDADPPESPKKKPRMISRRLLGKVGKFSIPKGKLSLKGVTAKALLDHIEEYDARDFMREETPNEKEVERRRKMRILMSMRAGAELGAAGAGSGLRIPLKRPNLVTSHCSS